jgi:hypothetical protein
VIKGAQMSREQVSAGYLNRVAGWMIFLAGIIGGMVMGMWSFEGPVSAPAALADYSSLPRRLTRLAHIAAMALGMTNVLYGQELPRLRLSERLRRVGAHSMVAAAVLMPTFLTLAAFLDTRWKFALPIPATATLIGVTVVVAGLWRQGEGEV